jgi:hypothetical protein
LVNTICGVPITPIIDINILELLLKFLPVETPLGPQPKLVIDPVSIPFLTKFVVGATTIFTLMIGIIK